MKSIFIRLTWFADGHESVYSTLTLLNDKYFIIIFFSYYRADISFYIVPLLLGINFVLYSYIVIMEKLPFLWPYFNPSWLRRIQKFWTEFFPWVLNRVVPIFSIWLFTQCLFRPKTLFCKTSKQHKIVDVLHFKALTMSSQVVHSFLT